MFKRKAKTCLPEEIETGFSKADWYLMGRMDSLDRKVWWILVGVAFLVGLGLIQNLDKLTALIP